MSFPTNLTTIIVTGQFSDLYGNALEGSVSFRVLQPVTDATGKMIFSKSPITVRLNKQGRFSVVLPCTDNANLNPVNFVYAYDENIAGTNRSFLFSIPSTLGATVDVSALTPVVQVGPFSSLVSLGGDIGGTAISPQVISTHLTNPLPVTQGGTSASTAAIAKSNLGAATVYLQNSAPVGANVNDIWINNFFTIAAAGFNVWNGTTWLNAAWGNGALPAASTTKLGIVQYDGTVGDIQPSPGTAALGAVGKVPDVAHVHPQPPMFAPTGLTGATAASRYIGAVSSGPPTTGTFAVGDHSIDQAGTMWVCVVAGTPGTWINVGDQRTPWTPYDSAQYLATNGDPMGFSSADNALVAGVLYLMRVNIRYAFTWTNVGIVVTGAGVGSSTGTFVGLYNNTGALLSGSADIGATVTSNGWKNIPLTTPQNMASYVGSWAWVGFLTNLATTQPTINKSGGFGFSMNGNLTTSNFRHGSVGTSQTTLVSQITLANVALSANHCLFVTAT